MKASFWNTFSAAPHRLFFFSGAIQLVLPLLLWCIELTGRYTGLWSPIETVIPTTWAHGFVMVYGVFIFFISGFLLTVFPRWMNGRPIEKSSYTAVFIWLNAGIIIFELGLFHSLTTAFSGIIILLIGWFYGISVLYQSYKNSPAQSRRYETVLLLALTCGGTGMASYAGWIYTNQWLFLELSRNIGFWLYLMPVLFTVSHRMIPFFSKSVIADYKIFQPAITLWGFLAGCIAHFVLLQQHADNWLFIADIPMAAIALLHSIRWQFHRSFQDRLTGVLHMAFFWVFAGMSLFSIQSLLLLMSGEYILNKAPLHAISIGFFASLLVAMASRVSMGHSGRVLKLDNISGLVFIGIQLAAVMRILSDIEYDNTLLSHGFNLTAALLWLLCMSTWFIKYVPMYLNVRIDGKEG
ncbi:MAG TPA: NnrS family protein [Gammaproteobacteria bacterium]|nr:NnrS family protein [Gammaproteobacteria bacterium]